MKCSLLQLIFVITFSSVVYGFSIPKVSVKVLQPKGLQFSLQEDGNVIISDIQMFVILSRSSNINNSKFIDAKLLRDENGLWIYTDTNTEWSTDESIEYWLSVECFNLGYYTNKIIKVQDIKEGGTSGTVKITATSTTTTTQSPCEASVTTVNGKSVGCKNSIIFHEDFNSDNLKYWSYDTRFPLDDSSADAEFNVYEKRPETSFIRDNVLVVKAELLTKLNAFDDTRIRLGGYKLGEKCTPISSGDVERECERQASFGYILPPVTSAFLTTRNKFSFMYGKVEIRCRVPIGDFIYAQTILQPVLRTNSSEHLKVFFVRGNEKLVDNKMGEIGGSRVFGGAIMSRKAMNIGNWLKNKTFPNDHLGNNFHVYELVWTPSVISLFIDGINYGSLNSNLRESAIAANIKSAVNWAHNGPFDKEHFLSLMLAAGSVKNFYTPEGVLQNGEKRAPKPWDDNDPRAERSFYLARDEWYPTWKKPTFEVDYIKIYSV